MMMCGQNHFFDWVPVPDLFLTVPLFLRPLPWAIRVYPPKLGVLGLSFAITGDEKKS
jgi:hypothetical protein